MEVGDQAQTVLTLGLDQITKFIYRLDGSNFALGLFYRLGLCLHLRTIQRL